LDQWLANADRQENAEPPEVAMEVDRFGPMDQPGDRNPSRRWLCGRSWWCLRGKSAGHNRVTGERRVCIPITALPFRIGAISRISARAAVISNGDALSKGTVLNLEVRAGTMRLQTRGKVQSSLPGKGMGVQFRSKMTSNGVNCARSLSFWPPAPACGRIITTTKVQIRAQDGL